MPENLPIRYDDESFTRLIDSFKKEFEKVKGPPLMSQLAQMADSIVRVISQEKFSQQQKLKLIEFFQGQLSQITQTMTINLMNESYKKSVGDPTGSRLSVEYQAVLHMVSEFREYYFRIAQQRNE